MIRGWSRQAASRVEAQKEVCQMKLSGAGSEPIAASLDRGAVARAASAWSHRWSRNGAADSAARSVRTKPARPEATSRPSRNHLGSPSSTAFPDTACLRSHVSQGAGASHDHPREPQPWYAIRSLVFPIFRQSKSELTSFEARWDKVFRRRPPNRRPLPKVGIRRCPRPLDRPAPYNRDRLGVRNICNIDGRRNCAVAADAACSKSGGSGPAASKSKGH